MPQERDAVIAELRAGQATAAATPVPRSRSKASGHPAGVPHSALEAVAKSGAAASHSRSSIAATEELPTELASTRGTVQSPAATAIAQVHLRPLPR